PDGGLFPIRLDEPNLRDAQRAPWRRLAWRPVRRGGPQPAGWHVAGHDPDLSRRRHLDLAQCGHEPYVDRGSAPWRATGGGGVWGNHYHVVRRHGMDPAYLRHDAA